MVNEYKIRRYPLYPAVSEAIMNTLEKFNVNANMKNGFSDEELEIAAKFDVKFYLNEAIKERDSLNPLKS